jgi:NAD(P)-dependent dehydrogenase (short-subunit alcohol dehydrogenase family)
MNRQRTLEENSTMSYFVTGATGFIGRRLVATLLQRDGSVFFLVRDAQAEKVDDLLAQWGVDRRRAVPIAGDITKPGLGLSDKDLRKLRGKVSHVFHLAALYDLKADAASQVAANVEGTRNVVDFAARIRAERFHHVSSIAAAGLYDGVFREDMFEEAENLDNPYYRTKHDSEGVVRAACKIPWRVYRPGVVVGDSRTGEADKIDGPYYLFKLIQTLRRVLPPWMPTIGLEGGRLNLVPVDFVVAALDHIAHRPGEDGKCFHLTDPAPRRFGDMVNLFARAAHAPTATIRLNARMFEFVPMLVRQGLAMLPPVRRLAKQMMSDLGLPPGIFDFINYPTRFDSRETQRVLAGSGIEVPSLETYAWRLWDYWERHMDPELFQDHSLSSKVRDRVAMVTGASSGIGKATALKLAAAGAKVVLVARGMEKLQDTLTEIETRGGQAWAYSADLADMGDCDRLVQQVLATHGGVDLLVNNAGRSIRRAIAHSYDRFHDFERTMQLNYFGSLRVTMGLLPEMSRQRRGHVINISSIGVLSNAPRFSAYVASKAALDAFSRCAASEFADVGVSFTTINMPLVRTPMIAPTTIYQNLPTLSPDEAADLVAEAIINRPTRIATRMGIFSAALHALAPKLAQTVLNTSFRLFPDSSAAKGDQAAGRAPQAPSAEQIAFAQFTQGIHW